MELHETIKYVRKKMKLTQKEVCKGIVSHTTYCRFENGQRTLTLTELEKILERFGMQFADINDIQRENDENLRYITNLIQLAFNDKLSKSELYSLYIYTKNVKDQSLIFLRYFYYIRQHFHSKCPQIPRLKQNDIDNIYKQIQKSKHVTPIYLQFVIDFTVQFSDNQIEKLADFFINQNITQIMALNSKYTQQLPDALSNIADNLIDRSLNPNETVNCQLLDKANKILESLLDFLKIKFSSDHLLLYRLSKHRYYYYTAQTKSQKNNAKAELEEFLTELKYLQKQAPIPHIYADMCLLNVKDTLENKLPSENIKYIIN